MRLFEGCPGAAPAAPATTVSQMLVNQLVGAYPGLSAGRIPRGPDCCHHAAEVRTLQNEVRRLQSEWERSQTRWRAEVLRY